MRSDNGRTGMRPPTRRVIDSRQPRSRRGTTAEPFWHRLPEYSPRRGLASLARDEHDGPDDGVAVGEALNFEVAPRPQSKSGR